MFLFSWLRCARCLLLVLLILAGLFLRALDRATRVDPGFEMKGLNVVSMDLSLAGLKEADGTEFAIRFLERVRALPSVISASWAWSVPLDGGGRGLDGLQISGKQSPNGSESWDADWSVVTPGYFATMKIPLAASLPRCAARYASPRTNTGYKAVQTYDLTQRHEMASVLGNADATPANRSLDALTELI